MARRRKKHEEEHVDESWLIPYADMLTLLLALFIVLFAASNIDAEKFKQISESFNVVLKGGTGVLEQPAIEPPKNTATEEITEEEEKEEKHKLDNLQQEINRYIKEKQLTTKLDTHLTDEGLLVVILDDALFDSGSAKIKPGSKQLANDISHFLVTEPKRNIVISGHTDNIPIENARFDSNWHLSVIRAVNFTQILLANKNLDPRQLSAKGFGEYKPVESNDTKAGRAKNRRVEILIQPYEQNLE